MTEDIKTNFGLSDESYQPTEFDIRRMALEMATSAAQNADWGPELMVRAARIFENYLKGQQE